MEKQEHTVTQAWDEPLTQKQIKYVEEKFGPLANTLSELAGLVREVDCWRVEPDPDQRDLHSRVVAMTAIDRGRGQLLSVPCDIYKLVFRVLTSARKLRPKIEMVVGVEQAAIFYSELVNAFALTYGQTLFGFIDTPPSETMMTVGSGIGRGCEGIARKLEDWHRKFLLIAETEMTAGVKQDDTTANKKRLPPPVERAYQSYQYAVAQNPQLNTDKEAYSWLEEHGHADYDLPAFATWQRYLRTGRKRYGTQKTTPRAGRFHNIPKSSELESLSDITSKSPQKAD